jgi:hypothetical protein
MHTEDLKNSDLERGCIHKINEIIKLTKDNPNDMNLGKEIRKYIKSMGK